MAKWQMGERKGLVFMTHPFVEWKYIHTFLAPNKTIIATSSSRFRFRSLTPSRELQTCGAARKRRKGEERRRGGRERGRVGAVVSQGIGSKARKGRAE